MRTEEEMYALILSVAKADDRVRAVGMNGSRVNPNAPQDQFQDYDIVYFVAEMDSFIEDPGWVDVFGERVMMQMPEAMAMFPPELGRCFSYLMLFSDGNRLDLMLSPMEKIDEWREEDRLATVLLDKDYRIPDLPPPSDQTFWVKRPSAAFFADCCNEFWWGTTYVAKGLWREEIIYAYDHLQLARKMFLKMIEWKVGIQTDFSVSIGKNAKYLPHYIDEELWNTLIASYPLCHEQEIWKALHLLMDAFEENALEVAEALHFRYPLEESKRVRQYIRKI